MAPPSWIGQTIGGRYKIDSLLGQGGMSSVYRGTDPNLRRTVAIKLIHSHLATDPEFVRRFEEEAAAVAGLRHPNIVQVFDFNHDDGTYFMVLEFVEGESLYQRLDHLRRKGQRLPIADTVNLLATVCEAVQYAHDQGLIHRDIKPANVMLNKAGHPILMDFGVAKIIGGSHHTATGAMVGTPDYIAPELVRGETPDFRVDIYALGIMLYEMLAGQVPFSSDTALGVMLKHVDTPPPDARMANPDVPTELAAVIDRALAKRPGDRFQSAREMAAALRKAVAAGSTRAPAAKPVAEKATPPARQDKTSLDLRPSNTLYVEDVAPPRRNNLWPLLVGLGGLLGLFGLLAVVAIAVIVGLQVLGNRSGTPTGVAIATEAPATVQVGVTAPVATPTAPPTQPPPTDTPPPPTSTPIPVPDGMTLIPPGFFQMGSSNRADEQPEHPVLLDAFYIDTTEVTNAAYRACVQGGGCTNPATFVINNAAFDLHPVFGVSWNQARDYCTFVGKRLPTEAEWEYAAGGPDNFNWPWGNSFDASLSAASAPDLQPVGSYPGGASPFGVLEMAGNVTEWVRDKYSASFYAASPLVNPLNLDGPDQRVYRGGSYGNTDGSFYTTSRRFFRPATFQDVDVGFRCAQDASEENAALPAEDRDALVARFCEAVAVYRPESACP